MPTYEYACTDCGQHIEVVQSMSDAPLSECGACGGRLRKVFSPIGIVFKGSGFYKTDSRASTAKAGAGKAEPSGASSSAQPAASDSSGSSTPSADKPASSGSSGKAAESA